jgi:hypothetical protein
VRARIYKVQRHGDGWFAFGIPVGLPRLRCTWEITDADAARVGRDLLGQPVERDFGDPVRAVGVPERFAPTEGY